MTTNLTTIAFHLGTTTRQVKEAAEHLSYTVTHTAQGWVTTDDTTDLRAALAN